MASAQQLLGRHLAALAPEHGLGVADAEGLEPLQLAVKAAVDLLEAEQGFRFYRGAMACLLQPGLGQLVELLVQGGHLLGAHGEAPGGGVAAEALQ